MSHFTHQTVPPLKRISLLLLHRWWPAEVSHPKTIPDNIQRMRHDVGEFPVHFFGSNDYLWTYQARVFPYMDVDANSKEKMGKGVDATYKKGNPPPSFGKAFLAFQKQKREWFTLVSPTSFRRSCCTIPRATGRKGAAAAPGGQEERQEASSVQTHKGPFPPPTHTHT